MAQVAEETKPHLPTALENLARALQTDAAWWATHHVALTGKFEQWLASGGRGLSGTARCTDTVECHVRWRGYVPPGLDPARVSLAIREAPSPKPTSTVSARFGGAHDLRHSFASEAVMGGESPPMVGRILGHTQAQTTARYAHLADDLLQSVRSRGILPQEGHGRLERAGDALCGPLPRGRRRAVVARGRAVAGGAGRHPEPRRHPARGDERPRAGARPHAAWRPAQVAAKPVRLQRRRSLAGRIPFRNEQTLSRGSYRAEKR